MKRPLVLLPTLILALASCSAPSAPEPPEAKKFAGADLARAPSPVAQASEANPALVSKQVKTGSVTLEAGDLARVDAELRAKLGQLGGFVEHAQVSEGSRSLTLRIPAENFDAFLSGLPAWGRVSNQQVDVEDVTLRYFDLETRLKNQRLLLDQYRAFLAQARRMEDILGAMERISSLTSDIESTEGQFRYLSRRIDLSTLQVELVQPLLAEGRTWPDLAAAWADLLHGVAEFGVGVLVFLAWSVVVGPALVGLMFFVAWLWIGRPGLWRRLKGLAPKRPD